MELAQKVQTGYQGKVEQQLPHDRIPFLRQTGRRNQIITLPFIRFFGFFDPARMGYLNNMTNFI
jgi:hypothetical protein